MLSTSHLADLGKLISNELLPLQFVRACAARYVTARIAVEAQNPKSSREPLAAKNRIQSCPADFAIPASAVVVDVVKRQKLKSLFTATRACRAAVCLKSYPLDPVPRRFRFVTAMRTGLLIFINGTPTAFGTQTRRNPRLIPTHDIQPCFFGAIITECLFC
jgi:hypothetical protein